MWVQSTTWLSRSLPCVDFDPALGMMTGIPPINPMMPGLGIVPPPIPPDMPAAKEIIHCKSCTLFPPNPRNYLCFVLLLSGYIVTRVCVFLKYMREEPLHGLDLAALGWVTTDQVTEQQEEPVLVTECLPFQEIAFSVVRLIRSVGKKHSSPWRDSWVFYLSFQRRWALGSAESVLWVLQNATEGE